MTGFDPLDPLSGFADAPEGLPVPEKITEKSPLVASPPAPPSKPVAKPAPEPGFDWNSLAGELDDCAVSQGGSRAVNDLRGFISTGCFVLDAQIGQGRFAGGYPIGRFTEIYGTEGVGKTTMATAAMVACQQGRGCVLDWVEERDENNRLTILPRVTQEGLKPGLAILIDSEFKWALDRAQAMGLNPSALLRIRTKEKPKKRKKDVGEDTNLSLEYCLEELESLLTKVKQNTYFQRPDVPVLVVWDSLAASPIEAEMEGSGLQDGIAAKARKVRAAMRRMTGLLAVLNVTVLIVNQVYDRIGIPGVETPGGRGLKFHSSHRMQIKKKEKFMVSMKEVGIKSSVKAVKSSVCPPTHETMIPIRYTTGIDEDAAILDFFMQAGRNIADNPFSSAGSWLKVKAPNSDTPISFQYSTWSKILAETPGLRDFLCDSVLRHLRE